MSKDILVGLDAGTSLIKFVAFDLNGKLINQASVKNEVNFLENKKAEQNLNLTWIKVAEAFKLLDEKIENLKNRIVFISITGQGDGSWLIDSKGEPTCDAPLWLDGRSGEIVDKWRNSKSGTRYSQITGTGLNPSMQTGQMYHFKKFQPEIYDKTSKVLRCKDWIYYKMTNEILTDITEGCMTWGDFKTRKYNDEILEILDLKEMKSKFPEMIDNTKHVGSLSADSANLLSLNKGTPIILAPVDIVCSAFGSGCYDEKQSIGSTVLGTAGIHIFFEFDLDNITNENQIGYTGPLPGSTASWRMISNMVASLNIDWIINIFHKMIEEYGVIPDKNKTLKIFEKGVQDSKPAKTIYHPFISTNGERGPFVNVNARAQFLGLNKLTETFDLVRSIYESLGYACKDCYESFNANLDLLRITGGASNSPSIQKILGAITKNKTQVIDYSEQGAAGACMVGSVATGLEENFQSLNKIWVDPYLKEIRDYDENLSSIYQKSFQSYKEGYKNMEVFWEKFNQNV